MWWTKKQDTKHDPYAAWRFRDYRLFFIGRVLSSMGYQMQSVAIGWELYERTGSALVLGGVGLVQVIPVILLTLPAGYVADNFDRKRTFMFTQVIYALCALSLAVLSYTHGSIFLIYSCLLLFGVANAFNSPSSNALLPQLIPVPAFTNAATWNSSAFQLASVVGPAVGGLLIAVQRRATGVYVLNFVLDLTCFVLIAMIVGRRRDVIHRVSTHPSIKSLAGGMRFIWQNQVILAAIALDMFAVLLGGAVTLLPIYAKDILQVGPTGLGWLRAAPSIGALFMAFTLAYSPPMKKAGIALLWSVAGFGVATIVFGLSRSFWLSLLMLVLSGALDNISVVIRHTLVYVRTPDDLRGRVSAINGVFISTSNQLGGFESGLTAALFGPVLSVVGGGIGTIVVVLLAAWIWPEIRRLGSLQEVVDG